MKASVKINNELIDSINKLNAAIGDIQLYKGFDLVKFEFRTEHETLSFDGLITDLYSLGESRIEFTVMYNYINSIEIGNMWKNVINCHLNVYFIEDIFHCNLLRGFKKIIISENVIESLEKGDEN